MDATNDVLEVAPFGEVRRHGVVQRMTSLVQNLHGHATVAGGTRYHGAKVFGTDLAGTARRYEQAIWGQTFHRQRIQTCVREYGRVALSTRPRKARRVENNNVVFAAVAGHFLE